MDKKDSAEKAFKKAADQKAHADAQAPTDVLQAWKADQARLRKAPADEKKAVEDQQSRKRQDEIEATARDLLLSRPEPALRPEGATNKKLSLEEARKKATSIVDARNRAQLDVLQKSVLQQEEDMRPGRRSGAEIAEEGKDADPSHDAQEAERPAIARDDDTSPAPDKGGRER